MASRKACPLAPTAETENCLQCRLCHKYHALRTCPAFKAMKPPQRLAVSRAQGYCVNCLALTHTTGECDSPGSCKVCGLAHHTLLHVAANRPARTGQRKQKANRPAAATKAPTSVKRRAPPKRKAQKNTHNRGRQAPQPPRKKTAQRTIARTPQGLQTASYQGRTTNRALGNAIRALKELQETLSSAFLQGGEDV
ncbi:PREDICTED: uncharacterized protein LOC108368305 [Rhagoletis zephyria]|uniref:uncharacterized protein LOC108368305 n=1 Tax=Rhagoletis zephyria TaxID=28612 RepID=UPI0008119681|nr:PREDICTED: uncharacterized protein LOC108368305 [Rhagoletis zephyria]XP_017478634.1 PREDICTED: uncharacterized protein LOC108368305 [Rhagoletis zephyria]XP_017478635.1 PREDICTED: uncharacterized protein LOC108368305 [Rhagoletis zephyria]